MSGRALTLPVREPRSGSLALIACALLAVAAGVTIAVAPVPWYAPLAAAALLLLAAAAWPFDRRTPVLVVLALVPLFPVTTIGPAADAFGGHGNELRAGLIVLMLAMLVIAYRMRIPKPPVRLRPVVSGLLALGALGAVAAAANAGPREGFLSLLAQLAGQPIAFAGLLVFFCGLLGGERRGRELILTAFSVGVVAQAGVIAVELLSGGAYDALRGFTRAQGTVGANFVSAFAMIGFFVGLAERSLARERGPAWLGRVGDLTLLAALGILVGAVARGGVLGVLIGGVYLLFADPHLRRRAPVIVAVVAVALAGSLLTPVGDLWTERLTAPSVENFDRPATWISGVRIGLDNPLTGLGEEEIVRGLGDVREYRQTPLGDTSVLPHNSWILSFSQGGVLAFVLLVAITALTVLALRPRGRRSAEERYYVAALIGIAAIALINNVFRHPELMVPVLMLISLVAVRPGATGRAFARDRSGAEAK